MSAINPFPSYPAAALRRKDVIAYLVEAKAQGWCLEVFMWEQDGFAIVLGEDKEIYVRPDRITGGYVALSYATPGTLTIAGTARNLNQLAKALDQAAVWVGANWPAQPTSARLAASAPASNFQKISSLIGASSIEAVFDPYLDNQGLASLSTIASLGGSIADGVRLLSSSHAQAPRRGAPRLTKTFVDAWLAELQISGELRIVSSPGEHRRFMLLGGGRSLILGPSLNSLAKNEASHVEADGQDRPFFDAQWSAATPL
jgi:hypothetical protein